MRSLLSFAMLVFAMPAASAGAAEPIPSDFRTFGDWYVACDNGGTCEAGAMGDEASFDGAGAVRVRRPAGPGAPVSLYLEPMGSEATPVSLEVDGRVRARDIAFDADKGAVVTRDGAMTAVRALADGKRAMLTGAGLSEPLPVSLAGSSAALRYMDAAQGRAGTTGAIVARGPVADNAAAPVLPEVQQVLPRDQSVLPDQAVLAKIPVPESCYRAADDSYTPEIEAQPLATGASGATVLVLLPCNMGAYNFSQLVLIGRHDAARAWSFEPAAFDYAEDWGDEGGPIELVNSYFDPESGMLSSYAKGRGLGDCGNSASYVWDGRMFRLVEATMMGECRGLLDWPTVWRAKVVDSARP